MTRRTPRGKKPSDRLPARDYREMKFQELKLQVERILAGQEHPMDAELEVYLAEVKKRGTYPDGLPVLVHMYGGRARIQQLAAHNERIREAFVWWSARAADTHETAGELLEAAGYCEHAGMNLDAARCYDAAGQREGAERCRIQAKYLDRGKPGWF